MYNAILETHRSRERQRLPGVRAVTAYIGIQGAFKGTEGELSNESLSREEISPLSWDVSKLPNFERLRCYEYISKDGVN